MLANRVPRRGWNLASVRRFVPVLAPVFVFGAMLGCRAEPPRPPEPEPEPEMVEIDGPPISVSCAELEVEPPVATPPDPGVVAFDPLGVPSLGEVKPETTPGVPR